MTVFDIGNNIYFYRSKEGDTIEDCPVVEKGFYIDIDSGKISNYTNNSYNDINFGAKTDQLFASIIRQIAITNIGTSYVNVFPSFYDGFPIPFDCNGFKHMGIVVLWNKNGGTGIHDFRLVDNADISKVLVHTEGVRIANDWPHDGLKNGRTVRYNISIPSNFLTFRGELRMQAKSTVGTDSPIFDGLLIYLIR